MWDDGDRGCAAADDRRGARARRPGRDRAAPHRRPWRELRVAAAVDRPVADRRATSPSASVPKAMTIARHPPRPGRLGAGGAAARATPGSTSSTSTAATPICWGSSCRRTTTGATDEYGGCFANRARFWLETLEAVRDAVGDDCAIACRVAVDAAGRGSASTSTRGSSSCALADHLVDLWDVNVGSIAEWSQDSGPSRFFAEGWQLEYTGRVREATAKPIVGVGRLTDPDLMARDRPKRRVGPDRRGPAVDRRSVPAAQDRRGPAGRDPRVHRLQRLHLQGRHPPPPGLHAEPDRGRGVPPRLAPRAVRSRAANADRRRAGRRRRPGRYGVRDHPGQARLRPRHGWSNARRSRAGTCAGSRGCPAWASGAAWSPTGWCRLRRLPSVELDHRAEPQAADDARAAGADDRRARHRLALGRPTG